MAGNPWNVSKTVKRYATDARVVGWMIAIAVFFAGFTYLKAHPEHYPFAPLDTRQPVGVATSFKIRSLIGDTAACRATLERSDVAFETLTPTGEGACALIDRTRMTDAPLAPAIPTATCPVAAGLEVWFNNGLQQAAEASLGSRVVRLEHLGTNSCRRINGSRTAPWSEHATGNAIDIAAFVLADGRRISVLDDWGRDARGTFLKAARDAACDSFQTVLSPDYNAEHADHFHLDQGIAWNGVCR